MLKRSNFEVEVIDCDVENSRAVREGTLKCHMDGTEEIFVCIKLAQMSLITKQELKQTSMKDLRGVIEEQNRNILWDWIYYDIVHEIQELRYLCSVYGYRSEAVNDKFNKLFKMLAPPKEEDGQ